MASSTAESNRTDKMTIQRGDVVFVSWVNASFQVKDVWRLSTNGGKEKYQISRNVSDCACIRLVEQGSHSNSIHFVVLIEPIEKQRLRYIREQ